MRRHVHVRKIESSPFPTFRVIFDCFSKPTLASVAEFIEDDVPVAPSINDDLVHRNTVGGGVRDYFGRKSEISLQDISEFDESNPAIAVMCRFSQEPYDCA